MAVEILEGGWASCRGRNGILYGCQTRRPNWWCRTSGIATVYDVGEGPRVCLDRQVPADVVAAVDAACPDRVRP
jgi:hypothetical protein